ncbi:hypothetical protein BDV26DRAFT_288091 [Aspergillus bertholletiae]|uniref:Uncharacterized protein n=1 Tax=Aspergillus bertholletiae TaxID=1226010 RepID=A0A5N7BLX0_9EURO|nr:hypothetical protein BDV26DRAFT_288091 [Aspergillus bertholletiae]
MEPSPRSWEPTPASLLWAHEIRRENIHLADEIHKAKADLSSTVDTIDELRQDVDKLSRRVKHAETNASGHFKRLENEMRNGSNDLLRRVEALEIENERLKEELKDVRRECAARSKVLGPIKPEAMNEVRTILAQEKAPLPCTELRGASHDNGGMIREGSDILVPDSLPQDITASTQEQEHSLQAMSETTWGPSRSNSIEGRNIDLVPSNRMIMQGQEDLHHLFRQNARPLGVYWSYATDTRIQLPLWVKSGDIAKAFVRGLEDTTTRSLIERKLYAAGWSWDALADIMHDQLKERNSATKESSGKPEEASKRNTPIKRKKKKQRREIPIIPADEDDLLELNS